VPRPDLRRLPRAYLVAAAALPLAVLVLWVAVLLVGSRTPTGAVVGAAAPDFALVDLDGNPLRLDDLRGRPVVVNFWASWCAPCVREFPLMRAAAERHRDVGLAIVGVIYQDRSEAAREFMDRMSATWPSAVDPGGEVAARYGISGPPETFFIDRGGTVAARQIGELSADSLDDMLAVIIGEE
jgi:cytochrome c biogenesis protein CcmG, thiol:disulfide interchange protein DsbE